MLVRSSTVSLVASERASCSRSSVYYYTWYSHVPPDVIHISFLLFLSFRLCTASSQGLLKARDRESTLKALNFRPEADWLKVGLNQNRPTGFSEKIRRRNVRLRLRGLRLVQSFKSTSPSVRASCELNHFHWWKNSLYIYFLYVLVSRVDFKMVEEIEARMVTLVA